MKIGIAIFQDFAAALSGPAVSEKRSLGIAILMALLFTINGLDSQLAACQSDESVADSLQQKQIQLVSEHVNSCLVQIEWVGIASDRPSRTTGTLIDNQGYILTHATDLTRRPDTILVTTWEGKQQLAQWVAVDHVRNLLLLKTEPVEVRAFCVPVDLQQIEVGQTVLAMGKMLDAKNVHVSEGVVSAKGRIWGKATQTDAKVSPLNYGGPLVDLQGRMVGILAPLSMNVRNNQQGEQWYDSGIGFAVDLSNYGSAIERLKSGRDILNGVSGIEFQQENLNSSEFPITSIYPDSPAEVAGLQVEQQIVEINGQPVSCLAEFFQVYHQLASGDDLVLKTKGSDGIRDSRLKLIDKLPAMQLGCLGVFAFQDDSQTGALKIKITATILDETHLQVGDLLHSINETRIETMDDLLGAASQLQPDTDLKIIVSRENNLQTIQTKVLRLQDQQLPNERLLQLVQLAGVAKLLSKEVRVHDLVEPATLLTHVQEENHPAKVIRPLLVVLRDSLQSSAAVQEQWKPTVEKYGFDLMVVGPQAKKWTMDDANCLELLVQESIRKDRLAPSRARALLVLGDSIGVAQMILESNSEQWGGIAFWEAAELNLPELIQNDPSHRLMWLAIGRVQPEWIAKLQSESVVTGFIDSKLSEEELFQKFAAWLWRVQIW